MGFQNQIELISQIITNPKFISLFRLSNEFDKFEFVSKLENILSDEECFDQRYMNNTDKKRLNSLIKEHKYLGDYLKKIKSGEKWQNFNEKTEIA